MPITAKMETVSETYSEQEAEQILRAAAQKSAGGGDISRDRLLQMAAEAGIEPEHVLKAELEIAASREDAQLNEEYRRKMRSAYLSELSSSISVVAVCTAIWFFSTQGTGYFWPMWVVLGVGIGLVSAFAPQMLPNTLVYQAGLEKYKSTRRTKRTPSKESEQIRALLEDYVAVDPKNKIGAIRLVRERTGMGLKEAKEEVESYYLRAGID